MTSNFGEELPLDEVLDILSESSFGPELTLNECLEILRETNRSNLPDRAKFWETHMDQVQASLKAGDTNITIEGFHFKIEYHARISIDDRFSFGKPLAWIKIGANGSDPQSSNRDNSNTDVEGNPDVRTDQ